VPKDVPGDKSVYMPTSQPAEWVQAFTEEAKANGMTLSEWVGYSCLYRLPLDIAEALCDRPKTGRRGKSA
jgi:hypothetical protein